MSANGHDLAAVVARPLLRGWSHVAGFVAVCALGGIIIGAGSARARPLLCIYVLGCAAMFGVSALYHRIRWDEHARRLMARLDHSAIYLAIAGTYTPVAGLALASWYRPAVLGTAWGGAAIGIALQWTPVALPRWLFTSIYAIVGWSALLAIPQLFEGLGALGFSLVLAGGVMYTLGAVVYATRRPDPWPAVLGFHEVFHLCTIVAAGLHMAAVAFTVPM